MPRLPAAPTWPLLVAALAAAGCIEPAGTCELERCEIWVCGEPRPACPCSDLCERPACAEVTVYARDPSDGTCVELPSPCGVPAGWEYFADPSACEGGGAMCRDHGECGEAETCDVRSCASDAVGTCVPTPEDCPESAEPVVGCDGLQYANDCERLAAGARLATEGVHPLDAGCTESGVWGRDPTTGSCSYFDDSCHVPEGWAWFFSRSECDGEGCSSGPVWVWDPDAGECVEIESECDVPEGWEFFDSRSLCEGAELRCGPDGACPDGLACDFSSCDAVFGTCVPLPAGCVGTAEGSGGGGVCGCDGVTYPDDCERLLAGVGLRHPGPCS